MMGYEKVQTCTCITLYIVMLWIANISKGETELLFSENINRNIVLFVFKVEILFDAVAYLQCYDPDKTTSVCL